jgi:predicted NAD-dependent protein-ADP-ribosyltransferase YbiA (DUF1768 family)
MGGPCYLLRDGEQTGHGGARGPACTDNFQIIPFAFDGDTWYSVEQCYQGMKYLEEGRRIVCDMAPYPEEKSRSYGLRVWKAGQPGVLGDHIEWRKGFFENRIEYMYRINAAKYASNLDLQEELLATKGTYIAGARSTWTWSKWNGLIQMQTRVELENGGGAKLGALRGEKLMLQLESLYDPQRHAEW